jgi:tetratricopeptide (TPR) repeat protein
MEAIGRKRKPFGHGSVSVTAKQLVAGANLMRVGYVVTVILALILAQPARALNSQDVQDCTQRGDIDRVISGCTRLLESKGLNEKNRAIAYNNRGLAYQEKGDADRAVADLTEAIRLAPRNAGMYEVRGTSYYAKGDYDRAIADLTNAVRLNPKIESALWVRGSSYVAKGDNDRALDDFNEALRINPKYADAYVSRGAVRRAKGDYDGAIADFSEALRLQPGSGEAYYGRGLSYQIRADYDRAIADYNEAIRIGPRDPNVYLVYTMRGNSYESQGDHDRALADYNEAIRIAPRQAASYASRGLLYVIKGDVDRAIADYSEAIRLDPKFATAFNNRGSAYFDKADYDRALADLNEAIRLDPNLAIAIKHRADIYLITGDYQRALADYNETIRIDSRIIAAFTGRGLTYEKMAKTSEARADFNSALAIPPHDSNAKLARDRKLAQDIARQRLAALADPAVSPAPAVTAVASPAATAVAISSAPNAASDHRVALVIGNSAYENAPALPNPARDATFVANVLRRVGFETVTVEINLRKDALTAALRNFAAKAEGADWAVVYYAGHGMEVGGVNYLIPTDARIAADRDIGFEAVPLEQVLNAAERARKLHLVILDACRDNPFANLMKRTMSVASRSVTRGLAAVEPEAGTLVVYSAKDGETAIDGDGSNSPFALAFATNAQTPGLEVRRLFDYVRDDVMEATGRKQKPFTYGSISGRQDFYFIAGR